MGYTPILSKHLGKLYSALAIKNNFIKSIQTTKGKTYFINSYPRICNSWGCAISVIKQSVFFEPQIFFFNILFKPCIQVLLFFEQTLKWRSISESYTIYHTCKKIYNCFLPGKEHPWWCRSPFFLWETQI